MTKRLWLVVAALVLLTTVSTRTHEDFDNLSPVVGSWEVDHIPGPGGPPPFPMLLTIHSDGTVVESDAGPPTPHLFTAGHGSWAPSGRREFLVTYRQINFDEAANVTGYFKARCKITLNRAGTGFTGAVVVDFYDPLGAPVFSGEGTLTGRRLYPERLN